MLNPLLLVLLVFFVLGALPTWPYSANWGYFPSGTLLLIAVVILVVGISGRRGKGLV